MLMQNAFARNEQSLDLFICLKSHMSLKHMDCKVIIESKLLLCWQSQGHTLIKRRSWSRLALERLKPGSKYQVPSSSINHSTIEGLFLNFQLYSPLSQGCLRSCCRYQLLSSFSQENWYQAKTYFDVQFVDLAECPRTRLGECCFLTKTNSCVKTLSF